MTIVFLSNYLSHHQIPFCEAMWEQTGHNFYFITTTPMDEERKQLGWAVNNECPYEICSYNSGSAGARVQKIVDEADVVIIGSAPDYFIKPRLKAQKLTFRYSERFYKEIITIKNFLRYLLLTWKHHSRFQKYPFYLLCASAYTAMDAARFGNYVDRCYKWGYFPETKQYTDLSQLLKQKNPRKILWCGRFLEWKHPEIAIEAVNRLRREGYAVELDFIGRGPMENAMRALIARYSLENCVHLHGSMSPEQVRQHMENAGIYLFTSDRQEGWGAVLNESMNSGCAVVANRTIGSVPFLIKDGENGLVYEDGNLDMLYEKVKFLLENPQDQYRLGMKAYKTITQEWNAQAAAERFLQLATQILNGNSVAELFEKGPCSKAKIMDENQDEMGYQNRK